MFGANLLQTIRSEPTFFLTLLLLLAIAVPRGSDAADLRMSGWHQKRKKARPGGIFDPRLAITDAHSIRTSLQARKSRAAAGARLRGIGALSSPMQHRLSKPLVPSLSKWEVRFNQHNGTPTFMSRNLSERRSKPGLQISAAKHARNFIADNRSFFRIRDPDKELKIMAVLEGSLGKQHICFQQLFEGLPMWGHDLVVHLNSGEPYAMNGRYSPTPTDVGKTVPDVPQNDAIEIARTHLNGLTKAVLIPSDLRDLLEYDGPTAELGIWLLPDTREPRLAWRILLRPNWRERWFYVIAADDGGILDFHNGTVFDGPTTGQGIDVSGQTQTLNVYEVDNSFVMIDASRPIFAREQPNLLSDPRGAIWTLDVRGKDLSRDVSVFHVFSKDNTWNDPIAVSAHHHTGRTFQYFFDVHGRRGIDNMGATIISIIHVTEDNRPMDNAFWNGKFTAYGDGDVGFQPFAASLDVVAHEITHGVVERTVNLEYRFQSGALNESFADVFGVMVDRDDWTLAEDIANRDVFTSGALRDMKDPHNGAERNDFAWQPAHMDEFVDLEITEDNGGVHINSGIPNRACFLIAEAIGRAKTEQIYYRILDARYLNSRSNFVDLRLAALRATADLFGDAGAEAAAVVSAFDRVGIVGDTGQLAQQDLQPVEGEAWIAVVNGEPTDNSLYLVRPHIETTEDVVQLTKTQVYTGTGNPISISDDGSIILFVDADNFIRFIFSDGTEEEIISENADWSSIALSPDGKRLAATSVFEDTTIYIFDLENPDLNKQVTLYNPTTQEDVNADVTLYADALDWDLSSEFIIYDAFNSLPQADGDSLNFWSINLLDVDNEIILPLFPPLPEGLHAGNPSFGQTNDNVFAFDLYDEVNDLDEVWAADLFTGTANLIEDNGSSIGYPRYSADDSELVFQRFKEETPTLRRIGLADDKVTAVSDSESYLSEGQLPTWFTIGARPGLPTTVQDFRDSRPTAFDLQQNYPNPFNPETVIVYTLSLPATVNLTIYDVAGRVVKTLDSGFKPVGRFETTWSGMDKGDRVVASGVYFYRLQIFEQGVEPVSLTRKMTILR